MTLPSFSNCARAWKRETLSLLSPMFALTKRFFRPINFCLSKRNKLIRSPSLHAFRASSTHLELEDPALGMSITVRLICLRVKQHYQDSFFTICLRSQILRRQSVGRMCSLQLWEKPLVRMANMITFLQIFLYRLWSASFNLALL